MKEEYDHPTSSCDIIFNSIRSVRHYYDKNECFLMFFIYDDEDVCVRVHKHVSY